MFTPALNATFAPVQRNKISAVFKPPYSTPRNDQNEIKFIKRVPVVTLLETFAHDMSIWKGTSHNLPLLLNH